MPEILSIGDFKGLHKFPKHLSTQPSTRASILDTSLDVGITAISSACEHRLLDYAIGVLEALWGEQFEASLNAIDCSKIDGKLEYPKCATLLLPAAIKSIFPRQKPK